MDSEACVFGIFVMLFLVKYSDFHAGSFVMASYKVIAIISSHCQNYSQKKSKIVYSVWQQCVHACVSSQRGLLLQMSHIPWSVGHTGKLCGMDEPIQMLFGLWVKLV